MKRYWAVSLMSMFCLCLSATHKRPVIITQAFASSRSQDALRTYIAILQSHNIAYTGQTPYVNALLCKMRSAYRQVHAQKRALALKEKQKKSRCSSIEKGE